MTALFGQPFDAGTLRRRTGHPNQVVGAELVEALDGEARGQRLARLRSGDIDCDVAVDRGLDITRLAYRGLPVHWMSPAGLRHPASLDPLAMEPEGWGELRTWPGGMLSTFGYDHVGVPAVYPDRHGHPAVTATRSPIHGRSTYSPTYLRRCEVTDGVVLLEGEVRQAAPFAEHLVLRRRLRLDIGGASVVVHDEVRNDGYVPEQVQMLYHVNVGWPVLEEGTQVRMSPHQIVATTDDKDDDPTTMPAPLAGAVQKVWDRACSPGPQWAALISTDAAKRGPLAVVVEWDGTSLPQAVISSTKPLMTKNSGTPSRP